MDPKVLRAVLKSVTAEAEAIVPTYVTTDDAAILLPELEMELKSLPAMVISLDDLVEKAKKAKKSKKLDTSDPGLFTRIMKTSGAKKATNPQAYSAAVHKKITGHYPAEDKKEKKK